MLEQTDDEHGLTIHEIISELAKYDVYAERKSIYRDFEVLTENFGTEIVVEKEGRQYYYHVGNKQFELAELKLLVDAVQSSNFITERKSAALIKKITKNNSTNFVRAMNLYADFFFGLANRSRLRSFAWLNFAARLNEFSGTETTFLEPQTSLIIALQNHQS